MSKNDWLEKAAKLESEASEVGEEHEMYQHLLGEARLARKRAQYYVKPTQLIDAETAAPCGFTMGIYGPSASGAGTCFIQQGAFIDGSMSGFHNKPVWLFDSPELAQNAYDEADEATGEDLAYYMRSDNHGFPYNHLLRVHSYHAPER